jgi:micrococcal nuclease
LTSEDGRTPPQPRRKDRPVFRFFLAVMLAVGFALSGCAPPEEPDGTAQGEQRSEKAAKEERPTKEKAEQERPDPEPDEEEAKPEKPAPQKANNEPAPPPAKPEPRPESPSAGSSSSASAAASASPAAGGENYDATVTVSRVVDGDTIEVSPAVDGNEEVRLIGMDTPETKDPSEEVEPLGPEASAFATDSLMGRSVGLEFDVEREDQYGRLLAYVYLGGGMFNEVLVEDGLAQAYPYEPNTRYEGRFAAAQEEARTAGIGIWGLTLAQQCLLADRGNGIGEGTPGCSGAAASASSSASASAPSPSPASAGSGGTAPAAPTSGGDIDCDQVNVPIPTPPGDPDGLDGDGDGLACE